MVDPTAIAITAIYVSGATAIAITAIVVSGVLGPTTVALFQWRQDKRRFHHERRLQDTIELRQWIDKTADALDDVVTTFESVTHGRRFVQESTRHWEGNEYPVYKALTGDLEDSIGTLERSLSRLITRLGEPNRLALVSREMVSAGQEVQDHLAEMAGYYNVASPMGMKSAYDKLGDLVTSLKNLRPKYDLAAHEIAGAIIAD